MKHLRKLRHWISHLFGMNLGHVEVWHDGVELMVGFRCEGCGELSGVHPASDKLYNDKPNKDHEQSTN